MLQMSPIYWLPLMMYFIFMLMMLVMFIYFFFNCKPSMKLTFTKVISINWLS